jgi:hypothetical protein
VVVNRLQNYGGLPETEELERGRRFPDEVSASGRTDSIAAVRLLRLESFAPLSEEPTEECRSSGSETTLQSSLGGPQPVELPPERVSDLLGGVDDAPLSRIVASSASLSPPRSSGALGRLMSVREYSKSR